MVVCYILKVSLCENRQKQQKEALSYLELETLGNVFRGLDSRTGLADWTHALSWKQLLNNNPGITHLLQHWRHHYRVTTADTALPYKLTN